MERRVIFAGWVCPAVLLTPQLAVTIVFFFWPTGQAVLQSLRGGDAFGLATRFVGADNFTFLFADPDYLAACSAARSGPVQEGNVGAGAGAVSGGVKGGLGTASVVLDKGIIVGAIVAVNSVGSTFDEDGNLYAASLELAGEFGNPSPGHSKSTRGMSKPAAVPGGLLKNTTIAVVATNVELTKTQATKIAQMADDGLARAIKPTHTPYDGDTVFAVGTGRISMASLGDPAFAEYLIGSAAADVLSRAVVHAILSAESTACDKSYCDLFPHACRDKKKGAHK